MLLRKFLSGDIVSSWKVSLYRQNIQCFRKIGFWQKCCSLSWKPSYLQSKKVNLPTVLSQKDPRRTMATQRYSPPNWPKLDPPQPWPKKKKNWFFLCSPLFSLPFCPQQCSALGLFYFLGPPFLSRPKKIIIGGARFLSRKWVFYGGKWRFPPGCIAFIFFVGPPVFYSAKCLLIVCGDMWAGIDKSFFNSSFSPAGGLWIDNANHHFGSPLFFPSSVFPNISGSHDSTRKKEDKNIEKRGQGTRT